MEFAIILYVYISILAFLGAAIFLINWVRMGSSSTIYKYVGFLFLAIAYDATLMTVARYYWNCKDLLATNSFLNSVLWETRLIPLALILTVFVGQMYYRFFIERKQID